ncbi:hypothetical protein P3T18_002539 [Paraburkholderia sp. GAS199]
MTRQRRLPCNGLSSACGSVNSLSDAGGVCSHNRPPLRYHTPATMPGVRRLPVTHPRAAIPRSGASSGAFHPNDSRHEDMTITAELLRRGPEARHPAHPHFAGRRHAVSRDALSLSPSLRPPASARVQSGPDATWHPSGVRASRRRAQHGAHPSPGCFAASRWSCLVVRCRGGSRAGATCRAPECA